MKRAAVLGVDVGGVIIDKANDGTDTSFFGKNFLDTTPVPGVFEALAILRERFNGELVIVSKAGPEIQEKTLHWMAHHDGWNKIGMTRRLEDHARRDQNVFFVRERKDKARICKMRSVTHFIDDRIDVLQHLIPVVPKRYLFGAYGGSRNAAAAKAVEDWGDALMEVWP